MSVDDLTKVRAEIHSVKGFLLIVLAHLTLLNLGTTWWSVVAASLLGLAAIVEFSFGMLLRRSA